MSNNELVWSMVAVAALVLVFIIFIVVVFRLDSPEIKRLVWLSESNKALRKTRILSLSHKDIDEMVSMFKNSTRATREHLSLTVYELDLICARYEENHSEIGFFFPQMDYFSSIPKERCSPDDVGKTLDDRIENYCHNRRVRRKVLRESGGGKLV